MRWEEKKTMQRKRQRRCVMTAVATKMRGGREGGKELGR